MRCAPLRHDKCTMSVFHVMPLVERNACWSTHKGHHIDHSAKGYRHDPCEEGPFSHQLQHLLAPREPSASGSGTLRPESSASARRSSGCRSLFSPAWRAASPLPPDSRPEGSQVVSLAPSPLEATSLTTPRQISSCATQRPLRRLCRRTRSHACPARRSQGSRVQ